MSAISMEQTIAGKPVYYSFEPQQIIWENRLNDERRKNAILSQRIQELESTTESFMANSCEKTCTCGMFTASFNDLPEEILTEIFRRLDIVNQINVRSVSKLWNRVLQSKSVRRKVILDLSTIPVSTTRIQLKKLSALAGDGELISIRGIPKRLIHIPSTEPREFEFLWFTQICEHFITDRPSLRILSLSNSFVKLQWIRNLPASITQLSLKNIQITESNTPGLQYALSRAHGIYIPYALIKMKADQTDRLEELWKTVDKHVIPLNTVEKNRLRLHLPNLRRKQALAATLILRTREIQLKDQAEVNLTFVNPELLRPSVQDELAHMVLEADEIYFDVGSQ